MAPPQLAGYQIIWSDDFLGASGSLENSSKWNRIVKAKGQSSNKEEQAYTGSASNAHLSGDGQLYVVPIKKDTTWTSARLESKQAWYARPGHAIMFQSEIRVPDFTGKPGKFSGLWPAFWALGESHRNPGVPWPDCGERDIMEVKNSGGDVNQATMHYRRADGEYILYGGADSRVAYQGGAYHTWAFKSDRRKSDRNQQTMTWYLDGKAFYSVKGSQFTPKEWDTLAWSPYYAILNVAVGGGYPGPPTGETVSGFESAMRVRYVAIYESI